MPINQTLFNVLKPYVVASLGADGYAFGNPKHPQVKALEREGFLESDSKIVNPENKDQIAFRATAKGIAEFPDLKAPETSQAASSSPSTASALPTPKTGAEASQAPTPASRKPRGPNLPRPEVIRSVTRFKPPVEDPSDNRRGPKGEKYPFGDLAEPNEEGCDSFFIPATDAIINPAKKFASNVTKANKKYPSRKFKIHAIVEDAEFGVAGARVSRVK